MRRLLPALALALQAALLTAQAIYWDNPRVLVAEGARFPQAVSGGGLVAVVWQEFEANRVWLSLRTSRDLVTWNERRRFAGPYAYQGEQAPLFSVEADRQGQVVRGGRIVGPPDDGAVLRRRRSPLQRRDRRGAGDHGRAASAYRPIALHKQ